MYCAVLPSVLQVLVLPVLVILELAWPPAGQRSGYEEAGVQIGEQRRGGEPDTVGECHPGTTWTTFRLAQPLFLNVLYFPISLYLFGPLYFCILVLLNCSTFSIFVFIALENIIQQQHIQSSA